MYASLLSSDVGTCAFMPIFIHLHTHDPIHVIPSKLQRSTLTLNTHSIPTVPCTHMTQIQSTCFESRFQCECFQIQPSLLRLKFTKQWNICQRKIMSQCPMLQQGHWNLDTSNTTEDRYKSWLQLEISIWILNLAFGSGMPCRWIWCVPGTPSWRSAPKTAPWWQIQTKLHSTLLYNAIRGVMRADHSRKRPHGETSGSLACDFLAAGLIRARWISKWSAVWNGGLQWDATFNAAEPYFRFQDKVYADSSISWPRMWPRCSAATHNVRS